MGWRWRRPYINCPWIGGTFCQLASEAEGRWLYKIFSFRPFSSFLLSFFSIERNQSTVWQSCPVLPSIKFYTSYTYIYNVFSVSVYIFLSSESKRLNYPAGDIIQFRLQYHVFYTYMYIISLIFIYISYFSHLYISVSFFSSTQDYTLSAWRFESFWIPQDHVQNLKTHQAFVYKEVSDFQNPVLQVHLLAVWKRWKFLHNLLWNSWSCCNCMTFRVSSYLDSSAAAAFLSHCPALISSWFWSAYTFW